MFGSNAITYDQWLASAYSWCVIPRKFVRNLMAQCDLMELSYESAMQVRC